MTRRVSSFDPLIAGAPSRGGSLGRLSARLARRRKSSFGLRRSFDHGEAAAASRPSFRFFAERQRPIHFSLLPILAAFSQRFGHTSEPLIFCRFFCRFGADNLQLGTLVSS